MDLVAGTYTATACDALGLVEVEVGVTGISRRVEVILTGESVADLAQSDHTGHVLQFAVAVGRTGQAVQRMVGDVELHDIAA